MCPAEIDEVKGTVGPLPKASHRVATRAVGCDSGSATSGDVCACECLVGGGVLEESCSLRFPISVVTIWGEKLIHTRACT